MDTYHVDWIPLPLAPPTGSAAVSSRAAADAGEPDYKQTFRVKIVGTVH